MNRGGQRDKREKVRIWIVLCFLSFYLLGSSSRKRARDNWRRESDRSMILEECTREGKILPAWAGRELLSP